MTRTSRKTKSRNRQPRANRRKFRRRNLAIWAALGTSITIGFSNLPLECSKIALALDYPTVKVDIQLRLNLEDVRYCEATPEKSDRVEEGKSEE